MRSRRTFLKTGALALTGALGSPFVITPSRAQSFALRLQGFLPSAATPNQAFERMAGELKTKTNGRLSLSLLPVGGAVAATETLNAMRAGILDGHYSSSAFFAATDPAFTLLGDTGASYDTEPQHESFWTDGPGQDLCRENYARYDAVYVGYVHWPSEQIPSRRAVRRYEDLRGLKIRVPPGMIAEILGKAGAAVVNLPGGEVFNALQSGVIDATDWAAPTLNNEVGLYKAAKFSVDAAHSRGATDVVLAKRVWDSLPGELRQLLSAEVKGFCDGLRTQLAKDNEAALAKMKSDGVEVINWSREDIAKLRRDTQDIQDGLAQKGALGKKVVEAFRAHQAKVMRG